MLKSTFLDKTIFGTRFSKVRPERGARGANSRKPPACHEQPYIATGSGIGRGKSLRESIISLNTADFTWNCTCYDVISAALERFEFCSLP